MVEAAAPSAARLAADGLDLAVLAVATSVV